MARPGPPPAESPRPRGGRGSGARGSGYFFLPWVLPEILVTCVFAAQRWWARAPGGRRWSSLAAVERPRTAQLQRAWLTASALDAPRPNLSRRQSATTAGAPTDQARVCLAAPSPASAKLPMPSTRVSHDGQAITTVLSHQLGKLRSFAASWGVDLVEQPGRGRVGLCRFPRDSPLFPAPSGAPVVRPALMRWMACVWQSPVWVTQALAPQGHRPGH